VPKNERSIRQPPAYTPKATEVQLDPDQKAYDQGHPEITRSPQRAVKTANDEAFQPWAGQVPSQDFPTGSVNLVPPSRDANIVGDLVAGMPRDGDKFRDTVVDLGADMASGGEPDGPKSANEPGAQNFYRSIKDFPGGQGDGDEPMQPGGQFGK
jgi:hypothetical protein